MFDLRIFLLLTGMKLAPFSYTLEPGPRTPISAGGYLMFVTASSSLAPHACFAIYYDDSAKIWHMTAIPCGTSSFLESATICGQIFSARAADIQEIVQQSLENKE